MKITESNLGPKAATGLALKTLIESYELVEVNPHGNEVLAYAGRVGEDAIRIGVFPGTKMFDNPPWVHISIAFGGWAGKAIGRKGLASCSSEWGPGSATALPGNDLPGLKWRVMAVAPNSKTLVQSVGDRYIKTDNIIETLLSLKAEVGK